jgi:GLPGLI family protein
MGGNAIVYKNLREQRMVSQENIIDRQFLISEPLTQIQWRLLPEEKMIGNHLSRKAISENGTIAWYAPDLPVSDGPGRYWGLPGLILRLETASQIISAQEITLNYDTEGKITAPASGRSVSREEFVEIRNQRMRQLGIDGIGQGGGVRIIQM